MRSPRLVLAIAACLASFVNLSAEELKIEDRRFLYDMTAPSAANPVIARVTPSGIIIPATEFRGYCASAILQSDGKKGPLTVAEKREHLERLVDEHLMLWDAFEKKWDQNEELVKLLKETENMLLAETLTHLEIDKKAKSHEEYKKLTQELRDTAFDKTDVVVSNEAYEELKALVKRLNLGPNSPGGSKQGGPETSELKPGDLKPETRDRPVARCKIGDVTIGNVLDVYLQQPKEQRLDIEKQESLIELLKRVMGDSLLVAEARSRGLEKSDMVREKLQQNRTTLTRFRSLDEITAKTVAKTKEAGYPALLRKWYDSQLKDRYTVLDENGKLRVIPFDDPTEQESIRNDHFEVLRLEVQADYVRQLRVGQKVEIDEKELEKVVINWPDPRQPSSPKVHRHPVAPESKNSGLTSPAGVTIPH